MFNKFKRWKPKGKMYSLRCFQCGSGFLSSFNLEAPICGKCIQKAKSLDSTVDDQIKETTQKLKEQQQIHIRYSKQSSQTRPTILIIVDNALSLIIDDKKQNSYEAIELASYSNNKSTIVSCTAIFENLWMQT